MSGSNTMRKAVAAAMIGVGAVATLTAAGWAAAPAALAATGPGGECSINAVISQDITRSFSDANLVDTKSQIQGAVQSFVGVPYPVTLGVTSFGRIAPLPTAPAMLGVGVTSQAGADQLKAQVEGYAFDDVMSGYTNWQAGLRDAFEKAKAQGSDTVVFVTDGVPNLYNDASGAEVGVGGSGAYVSAAGAAAASVAAEIRASGMHLETIFIRTDRPGVHGLDDPIAPTPDAQVEEAMQDLQPGWTIDRVITIAQLAGELRARAAAACTPAVSLTKSHGEVEDVNGNGLVDVGDRVVFVFSGRNEGDLPLNGVTVTDPRLADRGIVLNGGGRVGDLGVGQTYRLESAPYTLAEKDMADCGFVNLASVTGESLKGTIRADAEDRVITDTRPGIALEKTADPVVDANGNGTVGDAGDTVVWKIAVTNTGNAPWSGALVSDDLLDRAGLALTPDRAWDGALAAGARVELTSAPYTITAADVAAGTVRNTASVSAPAVCETALAASAEAEITTTPTPPAPTPTATPHTPRAFTGNPLAIGDGSWPWMVLVGVGGLSFLGLVLFSRRRLSDRDGQ